MASRAADNRARLSLAVAIGGLMLLWVLQYPPAISIADESAYLTQAQVFATGDLIGDASARTVSMISTEQGWVSKYPPAQSLTLAPTQLLHWRAGFLVPLGFVILASLFCAATLERNGFAGTWALLVLLHPAVVLYSRTMMSEALALLVVAVALWASDPEEPRHFVAGLAIGVMPAVRTALLPTALLLGGLLLLRSWRKSGVQERGRLVLGAGIPVFALAAYNQMVFGDPLSLRTGSTGFMDWSTAHERGLFYLLALNVLWPGMLVGVFAAHHRRKLDVTVLTAAGFLLYSGYYFVDRRYGMPTDLVVGFRFFVPFLPVMVLGYAALLHTFLGERIRSVRLSVSAAILLVVANAVLVAQHQGLLVDVAHRRDVAIEAAREGGAVIAHASAAELFNPAWGAPPVVVVSSIENLRLAVASEACAAEGAIGFAQGAPAVDLATDPAAVTLTAGLTIIRSDSSSCPGPIGP